MIAIFWIAVVILGVPMKLIKYFTNWANILLKSKLVFYSNITLKGKANLNTVSKGLRIGCKQNINVLYSNWITFRK